MAAYVSIRQQTASAAGGSVATLRRGFWARVEGGYGGEAGLKVDTAVTSI